MRVALGILALVLGGCAASLQPPPPSVPTAAPGTIECTGADARHLTDCRLYGEDGRWDHAAHLTPEDVRAIYEERCRCRIPR